ncbi:serine/threonine-protein kinase [Nocardia arizonensis]|uniref:serine/threonine-protein kinase n=1 Tax=Nocardia arizonensis TaxID=1141647 RepID=UPI00157D28C1|nr:serine/threonine-protein kinase [Nocardia arizonensis]
MQLQAGANFAGYLIERCLGVGGMGSVYLARHPRLERVVALKLLADAFTADPKARAAFEREVTLAARLDHPNIVAVYDRSGPEDDALWLTMRYVDGGDAGALLESAPRGLPPEQAVRLVADAAEALDFAHEHGVVHRDVKPANLLIEHRPRTGMRALLTDFGIARTVDDTVTLSSVSASFAYAAPERFTNVADHRADIYSLGCTLYHLLTGVHPFPRADQAAVIAAHLAEPPPAPRDLRPALPEGFDRVIATALAKKPGRRYGTCVALAEAAAEALTTVASPVPSVPARPIAAPKPAPPTNTLPVIERDMAGSQPDDPPDRRHPEAPGRPESASTEKIGPDAAVPGPEPATIGSGDVTAADLEHAPDSTAAESELIASSELNGVAGQARSAADESGRGSDPARPGRPSDSAATSTDSAAAQADSAAALANSAAREADSAAGKAGSASTVPDEPESIAAQSEVVPDTRRADGIAPESARSGTTLPERVRPDATLPDSDPPLPDHVRPDASPPEADESDPIASERDREEDGAPRTDRPSSGKPLRTGPPYRPSTPRAAHGRRLIVGGAACLIALAAAAAATTTLGHTPADGPTTPSAVPITVSGSPNATTALPAEPVVVRTPRAEPVAAPPRGDQAPAPNAAPAPPALTPAENPVRIPPDTNPRLPIPTEDVISDPGPIETTPTLPTTDSRKPTGTTVPNTSETPTTTPATTTTAPPSTPVATTSHPESTPPQSNR